MYLLNPNLLLPAHPLAKMPSVAHFPDYDDTIMAAAGQQAEQALRCDVSTLKLYRCRGRQRAAE